LNFVLVHGGFHGGWCWRLVADRLLQQGHRVTTPTQTGLGARRHLASNALTLAMYVEDIVNHMMCEDMKEVILVGHSFGGLAISGVAERLPSRIRQLVYLDALILQAGQTPYGVLPEEVVSQRRTSCTSYNGVRAFPPPPVSVFGIPEDHPEAEWVRSNLTPQPESLYDTPLPITKAVGNGLPCTYIACTSPVLGSVASSQAWARQQGHWHWRELATGHDAMVTDPDGLTHLLIEIGE
jgi:pimeloyl-ACP methyl ester carboxylesterase